MARKDVKLSNEVEMTSSTPDDKRLKKSWGYITAYPHEYLIHFKNGKFSEKTSGQGASCFKWPADTVFIIPTSLKEIVFQANQLSLDNVDIRIRGMCIYRIKDPEKIHTMLNFSNRQRAEEKLARMIGDLCRSITKGLVAKMNVDDCIRKRKEDIADALKKEVSLVVYDPKEGWGVEIVSIDIQDVYIQDDEIFNAMQIEFKTEKLRASELSQLEMKKDLEVRRLTQNLELAEHRKNNELEKARTEAELKEEKMKLAQKNDEKQFELERYRVEQQENLSKYKLEQDIERQKQKMALKAEEVQQTLETKRLTHEVEIEALQKKMDIENSATPLSLEKNFIESALPTVAEAIASSMSNSRINILHGDGEGGTPFKFVLMELLDIFRNRMDELK